jgi:phenylacetate-coenzyme A ligase PaaK-like adenylate-forming protein
MSELGFRGLIDGQENWNYDYTEMLGLTMIAFNQSITKITEMKDYFTTTFILCTPELVCASSM